MGVDENPARQLRMIGLWQPHESVRSHSPWLHPRLLDAGAVGVWGNHDYGICNLADEDQDSRRSEAVARRASFAA